MTFINDGLTYERQYGDLIGWMQTLQHVKEQAIKVVVFVTDDAKEDWWWITGRDEQKRTHGPHRELRLEVRREGGAELFWMYSFNQFLTFAKEHGSKISEASLAELKEAAEEEPVAADEVEEDRFMHPVLPRTIGQDFERHVRRMLSGRVGAKVYRPNTFPDWIAEIEDQKMGVECLTIENINPGNVPNKLKGASMRGSDLVEEGELDSFYIYLLVTNQWEAELLRMRERLMRHLSKHRVDGIAVYTYRPPLTYELAYRVEKPRGDGDAE